MVSVRESALISCGLVGLAVCAPSTAQANSADVPDNSDIIVTARRVEERLQDVPISIKVLSQNDLANNNVSSAKDLGAYTPSLQVNSRFGSENTTFTIRGFTQEQRTYATVGVFFADVVAPRGSGAIYGGDGAGPGSLFDLQNVQVLAGPQGTLQGRNTTGGAVLIVPQKPTGRFGGYVEGSLGDFDMRRIQAVVNVPVADTLRVRLGVDRQTRNGYLNNIGNFGDGVYGDIGAGSVNYWAARASIVADLTPNLENYSIATFSNSRTNPVIPKTISCNVNALPAFSGGAPFGALCLAQLNREAGYDAWTVANRVPNARATSKQWQIINTTTWRPTDLITVKNIMSYAEFRGSTVLDLFGNYLIDPSVVPGTETPLQVTGFSNTGSDPFSGYTNAESSFVEELQVQGQSSGGRLNWQMGGYTELNDPLGEAGSSGGTNTACIDVTRYLCAVTPRFSTGRVNNQAVRSKFRDYALYGQASYALTTKLKFTGGFRYTWDKQAAQVRLVNIDLSTNLASCANPIGTGVSGTFPYVFSQLPEQCKQFLKKATSAPTWLLGLDYKPVENVMVYAKYSRGYRQGGLALLSADTTQPFNAELVNVYEIGMKTSWRGAIPGSFNVSGYYNDFRDQQLLVGTTSSRGLASPSAAIVNAGKSRMMGLEAELNIRPFAGAAISISYAHLNSKLQEFITPPFPAGSVYDTASPPAVGGPIPNAGPTDKLIISPSYQLPLPERIGKVTVGATYVYSSSFRSAPDSCPVLRPAAGCTIANPGAGILPSSNVLNVNASWTSVGGSPVDMSFFMTNVTNEVYYLQANDNTARGFVSRLVGEPRMFGFRMKYHFGD